MTKLMPHVWYRDDSILYCSRCQGTAKVTLPMSVDGFKAVVQDFWASHRLCQRLVRPGQ